MTADGHDPGWRGRWPGRVLRFPLTRIEPAVFAAVAALLAAICLLASWLPARRATRVDPMAALRVE